MVLISKTFQMVHTLLLFKRKNIQKKYSVESVFLFFNQRPGLLGKNVISK